MRKAVYQTYLNFEALPSQILFEVRIPFQSKTDNWEQHKGQGIIEAGLCRKIRWNVSQVFQFWVIHWTVVGQIIDQAFTWRDTWTIYLWIIFFNQSTVCTDIYSVKCERKNRSKKDNEPNFKFFPVCKVFIIFLFLSNSFTNSEMRANIGFEALG